MTNHSVLSPQSSALERSDMVRQPVRFLARDIWDTPDDGKRYEVIGGDLYVTPPPNWGHQRGLGSLYWRVARHVYEHGLGEVVQAPVGVLLDDENGIQPDMVYISAARLDIIQQKGVYGAPDLVVEVLSPSTRARDRGIKMRRFAAAGVPHYWILDPRTQTLEARRLGPSGYELTGVYSPGDVFRPDLFPGLDIAIGAIWT